MLFIESELDDVQGEDLVLLVQSESMFEHSFLLEVVVVVDAVESNGTGLSTL